MTTSVDLRSDIVNEMAEEWCVVDALMGGTRAMRKAGYSHLPKWPNEDQSHYDTRLKTATLFPAFERTVSVMSGKPFAKPLTLSDDTPAEIQDWAKDIDKEGVNLHTFAAEMFAMTIGWGLSGILVETPKAIPPANGREVSLAQQKKAGIRPYFVRVRPGQLIGWRTQKVNGARQLVQLRMHDNEEGEDGEYGSKVLERVRVLTPGAWEVFEKRTVGPKPAEWVRVEEGVTGLDFIPFVPCYGFRTAFMQGKPPLMNLAYQNVKHWQSQSDQDTILHVARVPILFGKGFEAGSAITIGSSNAVISADTAADLKFVEHTGKAIEAGAASLSALEEQMIQTGAELLVAKPGQRTATEDANDAEGNKCDLQRITEGFEDSIDLALYYMAQYANLNASGNATLYKDFAAATLTDASAQLLISMQQAGWITKKRGVMEQQRRGVLSSDIDPEVEVAEAAAEGPAPGEETDAA